MARQGSLITVTNTANGRFDTSLCQALGISYRKVLTATITVVNEAPILAGLALMDRLLQSIQHKAGMSCSADPPTNDLTDVNVDDER